MIFSVKDALEAMGIPPQHIHFELFSTSGIPVKQAEPPSLTEEEEQRECDVHIQLDGEIISFSLEYGGQNLLDAAIDNGADLPYSCKGGVCSTCKAKVTEGEVTMDLNYALEPDEVAAGYVLMCQAHPRSESIFIDFDQK
jgi:ring-1,2-phenylacetyl-CoA epoxidase subunit PaaE